MVGIFLAAFSYTAALMGAGFASGQETLTFFVVFSHYGALGIVVASILIGMFGGIVSEYALRSGRGYNEITGELFPCYVRKGVDTLALVFSICTLAVMCACFGELLSVMFGFDCRIGAAILAVLTAAVLLKGRESTVVLNSTIGAVLFVAVSAVCLYLLGYREHQSFAAIEAAVSGASYAGYNLITAGTVLTSGRMFLKRRGEGYMVGVVSGIMIYILMTLMWGIISIYYGKINLGELPMLTLTLRESRTLALVYSVIMAAAVFTTALSNGLYASEHLKYYIERKHAVCLCVALGAVLSGAGFSRLINTAYRYSGAAGIIIAVGVMVCILKKMKKSEKQRY